MEIKVGSKLYMHSIYKLKRENTYADNEIYIDGIPFIINEITRFCGKRVTVSSLKLDSKQNIKYIKIKEDFGKFEYSLAMFELDSPKQFKVGNLVHYRNYRNPAKILCIENNNIYIEFKYPEKFQHTCQGRIPSGKGYLAHFDDLRLIEKRYNNNNNSNSNSNIKHYNTNNTQINSNKNNCNNYKKNLCIKKNKIDSDIESFLNKNRGV